MGLTRIVAPDHDPISLGEARTHCRVTSVDEDSMIVRYILAARQSVETYLRRRLVAQTWETTLDEAWPTVKIDDRVRVRIVLPLPPTQSVDSIVYTDTAGVVATLPADQYRVLNANQEMGEAFVEPAYGVTWPVVLKQTQAITVRFVTGYNESTNPLPEPIGQALLMLVAQWFEYREPIVTGTIVAELPNTVKDLLFPYRVFY